MKKCDVLIAGVGGQGILLCSNILGTACIIEGMPVKGAEVHGMAQRGGSVEAHVRIGCIYGPMIPRGSADILIAAEPLEGARFSGWLKKEGIAVVNTAQIPPVGQTYKTGDMTEILKKRTGNIITHGFTEEAIKLGSIQALNVLMLGAALKFLPLKKESIAEAIGKTVKKGFIELNTAALNLGMSITG